MRKGATTPSKSWPGMVRRKPKTFVVGKHPAKTRSSHGRKELHRSVKFWHTRSPRMVAEQQPTLHLGETEHARRQVRNTAATAPPTLHATWRQKRWVPNKATQATGQRTEVRRALQRGSSNSPSTNKTTTSYYRMLLKSQYCPKRQRERYSKTPSCKWATSTPMRRSDLWG